MFEVDLNKVDKIYIGNQEVSEFYIGNSLVWKGSGEVIQVKAHSELLKPLDFWSGIKETQHYIDFRLDEQTYPKKVKRIISLKYKGKEYINYYEYKQEFLGSHKSMKQYHEFICKDEKIYSQFEYSESYSNFGIRYPRGKLIDIEITVEWEE